MATSSPRSQDGSIRKIRSTGDIPRVPERVHLHSDRNTEIEPNVHDARPSASNAAADPELDTVRSASSPRSRPPSVTLNEISPARLRPSAPVLPVQTPLPQSIPPAGNAHNDLPHNASTARRIIDFLALGRNAPAARVAKRTLVLNTLCYNGAQFIAIVTLLILCGIHWKSPTSPLLSEWKACNRPLGAWASIWLVRVILSIIIGIMEFQRNKIMIAFRVDIEASLVNRDGRLPPVGTLQHNNTDSIAPPRRSTHSNVYTNSAYTSETPRLPYPTLYSRLTLLSSLITLSWFLTAHILEYSSINSCRHSSPHLWWLVFGILCTLYITIFEIALLGLIVLIIAPILFLFWNIFLICLGRHPLQNPHMIKPDIKGLPKSVVERIPLVIYIPPPPHDAQEKEVDNSVPHIYPPKSPSIPKPPQQRRFKLLRNFPSPRSKKEGTEGGTGEKENGTIAKEDDQGPISWEDNWEKTDYPFVALEGNRAACAICLLDFEEPKRKHPAAAETAINTETASDPQHTNHLPDTSSPTETRDTTITEEQREQKLRLEDAGEGPQPLRLLACGHVFHKTCLDPWLIDVSGRCPICQRKVELPPAPKKSRRRN